MKFTRFLGWGRGFVSSLMAIFLVTAFANLLVGQKSKTSPNTASAPSSPDADAGSPNHAQSYFHYIQGHMLEEQGRFSDAIAEYKLAIKYDPDSSFLSSELASAYARNGAIKDAVTEAESAIQKDPGNIDAHRLLGNIYRSLLGDEDNPPARSSEMLKKAITQYEAITQIDPTSTDDLVTLGQLYRRANNNDQALATFKHCLDLEPDSESCLTNLAFLYTDLSDNQQAIELLEKNLPKKVDSSQLYVAMGYAYQRSHNYKKAIEFYRKAIAIDHSNLNVNRSLAESLMQDGQLKPALDEYKAIVEADKSDAESYMRIGQIYRRMNNFDAALQNLLNAQLLQPDSIEVAYNLALLYEEENKYDAALAKLNDLLKSTEKKSGTYSAAETTNRGIFLERLGMVYRKMEKYPEAIKAFEQLRTVDKDNSSKADGLIIDTYRLKKDYDKAIELCNEAIKKYPKEERGFRLQLAQLVDEKGDYPGSITQLQALLKNSNDDRDVYLTMAQIQEHEKRYEDATKNALAAQPLAVNDDQKENILFFLGALYERQKKYDLAEATFHQTLKIDPENAAALNYLGYMLADRGLRLDEALKYVQKAVDLDPTNGAYLDSLGWVYFKMKKYDQAETYLLQATEKMPNDPTIHDHLGDIYNATNRYKLATGEYEKSLDSYRQNPDTSNVDDGEMAKVQKKLDELKARLAQNVNK